MLFRSLIKPHNSKLYLILHMGGKFAIKLEKKIVNRLDTLYDHPQCIHVHVTLCTSFSHRLTCSDNDEVKLVQSIRNIEPRKKLREINTDQAKYVLIKLYNPCNISSSLLLNAYSHFCVIRIWLVAKFSPV